MDDTFIHEGEGEGWKEGEGWEEKEEWPCQ